MPLTTSVKRYSPCCSHPISNTYFPGPIGYRQRETKKGFTLSVQHPTERAKCRGDDTSGKTAQSQVAGQPGRAKDRFYHLMANGIARDRACLVCYLNLSFIFIKVMYL